MKTQMRLNEDQVSMLREQQLQERAITGDMLFEKWSKKKAVGQGMTELYDANPANARNLAFVMENQHKYLTGLTETQLSTAFGGVTPTNIMKIIRLSYPNSVRGEIFTEWGMETVKDSIYYLTSVYGKNLRGETAGKRIVESFGGRYSTEVEEVNLVETTASSSSHTEYAVDLAGTGALAKKKIRPYTVKVMVKYDGDADFKYIGTDNGAGVLIGDILESTGNAINYTSGVVTVHIKTANALGANDTVALEYAIDTEDSDNYQHIGDVELSLVDYMFRARAFPLGVSWSKMTELLLGTTFKVDAEEALVQGAADEIKKALDFFSLRMGYRTALSNTSMIDWDANYATAGADNFRDHAQAMTNVIENAGNIILNKLNRGGVSSIYGGPKAIAYLKQHNTFKADDKQPRIGAHRVGTIDGNIPLYKVPSSVVPDNEFVTVWKNENVDQDSAILFGTLVPMYQTPVMEFKDFYKQMGLAYFGDYKVINPDYLVRVRLSF